MIDWLIHQKLKSEFFCAVNFSHVWLFATPWTVAHQAPLPMRFSRQDYWSGFPFPFPVNLPDPGIEPMSPKSPALADGFFKLAPPGKQAPEFFGCIKPRQPKGCQKRKNSVAGSRTDASCRSHRMLWLSVSWKNSAVKFCGGEREWTKRQLLDCSVVFEPSLRKQITHFASWWKGDGALRLRDCFTLAI